MNDTLVVVTDNSQARMYSIENSEKPLNEMIELVDVKERVPVDRNTSEYSGQTFVRCGQTYVKSASVKNFKKVDMPEKRMGINEFAENISKFIESERLNRKPENLILISNPDFLNLIRKKLSNTTRKLIKKEVNKDLINLGENEIRDYICNYTYH